MFYWHDCWGQENDAREANGIKVHYSLSIIFMREDRSNKHSSERLNSMRLMDTSGSNRHWMHGCLRSHHRFHRNSRGRLYSQATSYRPDFYPWLLLSELLSLWAIILNSIKKVSILAGLKIQLYSPSTITVAQPAIVLRPIPELSPFFFRAKSING